MQLLAQRWWDRKSPNLTHISNSVHLRTHGTAPDRFRAFNSRLGVLVGCRLQGNNGRYVHSWICTQEKQWQQRSGRQSGKWLWWLACLPACNEVLGSRTRRRVPINDGAVRCKMPPCNASSSNNPRIQEPTPPLSRHVGCLLSRPTRTRHVASAHWPVHCHTAPWYNGMRHSIHDEFECCGLRDEKWLHDFSH